MCKVSMKIKRIYEVIVILLKKYSILRNKGGCHPLLCQILQYSSDSCETTVSCVSSYELCGLQMFETVRNSSRRNK